MKSTTRDRRYFSDYFGVSKETLDNYGAYNISLIADLPLFIDPFLLFQSDKSEYQALHKSIIKYLTYLRDLSIKYSINPGRLQTLFYFTEVKENYFGFTSNGNQGRGLGYKFAVALNNNLSNLFTSFGTESVTKDTHLEKLCLITDGVGKDMISDFTTNLIKEYLLQYTEKFALDNIDDSLRDDFAIRRVSFNYERGFWTSRNFILPKYNNSFVILTPKDILTRENNWINRDDYISDFYNIVNSLPNEQLRSELNDYLEAVLSKDHDKKEEKKAIEKYTQKHPELLDYFILLKELNGEKATLRSAAYVSESENIFVEQTKYIINYLREHTLFYSIVDKNTNRETFERIMFLKDAIENKGLWRIFYHDGKAIEREIDIQLMFRLVWFRTEFDITREGDDGMGEFDYKISNGSLDKTIVEFKLASNSQIKRQLQNQLEAYKLASDAQYGYKVIIYYNLKELEKIQHILSELHMNDDPTIILIDATPKQSASKV